MTDHHPMPRNDLFQTVLDRRESRRAFLKGAGGGLASVALGGTALSPLSSPAAAGAPPIAARPLTFREIPHLYDETHHVADGYHANVLIAWGDPLKAGLPVFDPAANTGEDQAQRFGFNNDFIGFLPLPLGSNNSDHGLLCVNHEYLSGEYFSPGFADEYEAAAKASEDILRAQMAAIGHAVVEIRKGDAGWQVVTDSPYNRRFTATTPMALTGPVAGTARVKTPEDPTGTRVLGTFANCAGGTTPWGTVLTAEENIQNMFRGDRATLAKTAPGEVRNHAAMDVGFDSTKGGKDAPEYGWHRLDARFDIEKNPQEFNRFGYIVEIDPYDPTSTPLKRTALGRFQHEAATVVAEPGKPVVVYMGDDTRNECVYRFVSAEVYKPEDRAHNLRLLEQGTLYAARFDDDGTGAWLPLTVDAPWNVPEAGLATQADLLIEARTAARLAGATLMDRPEDVETNPVTGRTYVMLTNNSKRAPDATDAANPRPGNPWGHVLEILPPGADGARDHLQDHFEWDLLLLAGHPAGPSEAMKGRYHADISENGWFSCPDNIAFDPQGRLWITTDGFPSYQTPDGTPAPVHDGLWACEGVGPNRALTRHFFGCPRGAEMCGPCFTPDGRTLFVAVQHPGVEPGRSYSNPATRWPDFRADMPPRPAVVAITRADGGEIGG